MAVVLLGEDQGCGGHGSGGRSGAQSLDEHVVFALTAFCADVLPKHMVPTRFATMTTTTTRPTTTIMPTAARRRRRGETPSAPRPPSFPLTRSGKFHRRKLQELAEKALKPVKKRSDVEKMKKKKMKNDGGDGSDEDDDKNNDEDNEENNDSPGNNDGDGEEAEAEAEAAGVFVFVRGKFEAAISSLEKCVASIWEEVLLLPSGSVGRHDSFQVGSRRVWKEEMVGDCHRATTHRLFSSHHALVVVLRFHCFCLLRSTYFPSYFSDATFENLLTQTNKLGARWRLVVRSSCQSNPSVKNDHAGSRGGAFATNAGRRAGNFSGRSRVNSSREKPRKQR